MSNYGNLMQYVTENRKVNKNKKDGNLNRLPCNQKTPQFAERFR